MLIVSKRYHKLHMIHEFAWMDQVYYQLLSLKNFWRSQGMKIF
jgi:hypothetical protein